MKLIEKLKALQAQLEDCGSELEQTHLLTARNMDCFREIMEYQTHEVIDRPVQRTFVR